MRLGSFKNYSVLAFSFLLRGAIITALGASAVYAVIIPPDRLYSGWPNAGVTGGIPNSANMPVFKTINSTGDSTDRTSAINDAIWSCPSNQVIVLGPGTFRVDGQLYINNKAGVVVRGAGMGLTIIKSYRFGSWGWIVGNTSGDWQQTGGPALSADEAAGQTVL